MHPSSAARCSASTPVRARSASIPAFIQLSAILIVTGCAPPLEVGDGHLDGTLGPVTLESAVVPTVACETGCSVSRVTLAAQNEDGDLLMIVAYMPASLVNDAPGTERTNVRVVGCSRLGTTEGWDVDRFANRTLVRIEETDDPAWRRALVHAEVDLETGTQTVDGWVEYTSEALQAE